MDNNGSGEMGESLVEIMEKYRVLAGQDLKEQVSADDDSAWVFAGIQKELNEAEQKEGAYYCSLPSFIDIYRILSRSMDKDELQSRLLLFTLEDERGRIPLDKAYTCQQIRQLKEKIAGFTLRGDLYTWYSETQILLLLLETGKAEGRALIRRLERQWESQGRETRLMIEGGLWTVE